MVRETRHLWVGNLPENIREDRVREHFKRYGRVQSVKLLPRGEECPVDGGSGGLLGEGSEGGSGTGSGSGSGGPGSTSSGSTSATVAFMDIKSASKAHATEHILDERVLTTQYYEPQHIQHRFPSHGNSEDHGSSGVGSGGSVGVSGVGVNVSVVNERGVERGVEAFESRVSHGGFYAGERSNRVEHSVDPSTVDPGGYIPRGRPTGAVGYHVTSTRARDRLYPRASSYATGPPPPSHLDRHRGGIPLSSWLGYESGPSRYSSGPPPPSPAATDNYQEESGVGVNSGVVSGNSGGNSGGALRQHKKQRRKSRSGSSSPSGSSRSGSSSSSRSGSSAGSTSGDSSSPSSSPHRASNAAVSEDRRPLAICVRNLPARSSDTSLKDGLFHEYKKHGKVTWVKVVGAAGDRYALVCFKKPEDVEKALEVSHDKLFFGCKIEVAPYQGYDVEDNEFRPYEAELDEYHPKATRTLFIGNLEKDVTASELRKHFEPFGEIIEIDIKKQGAVSSYAFCQYSDISSVVKAMRSMDGEHLGSNRIKLGFGKSMPTTCVWVDGIGESISDKYLNMQFHQFGPISQVVVDRERGHALVFFEQIPCAQNAVKEMRGASLRGRRLQVDFASRECQEAFYEHLERQGLTNEKPWDSRPSPAATFDVARDRSFESAVTVPNTGSRFTRYETPPRARTASYSRTPGGGSTPGASPAHPTAMTRSSRRSYQTDPYYDGDYPEPTPRRFRSYDEFSQGSGASHDDYESCVLGDGKLNDDDLPPPPRRHAIQSVVTSVEPPIPPPILLPPPDIRHLQKERVHLLEQLEECHSSGDENFAPKKRPKLDNSSSILCDDDEPEIASLLVTSHSGRKGMDVRRVSDSKILVHHGLRRGSCEGRPGPCKRRRDTSSRHHEHHDGSRPGTPLVDERPENIIPSEPRRFRERSQEGPLSLPLPRFAAQMMNNNNTSNSNNNNSNSSSSSNCTRSSSVGLTKVTSPPCVASLPSAPSPIPQPPASPPPRHPSPSPASSDSETAPQSPSLEERIRSLDEKYEKWSGSRALSAAGGDARAKLDATASERFKFRHKLLNLDLNEVQPSDIVKSVLAKRSVFDEDSKRLENFNEKYEAREYIPVTGSNLISTNLPLIGVLAGAGGTCSSKVCLQYPFPSHPPVQQPGCTSSNSTNTTPSIVGSLSSSSIQTTVATTSLVSPSLKTDPRTAVHNCVHPIPATPITPGTSIKTSSPELPPVSLPISLASGTAASSNSTFNFTSSSGLTSNSSLTASTARTPTHNSVLMSIASMTSLSNSSATTAVAQITTATTTITTSSNSSHHHLSTIPTSSNPPTPCPSASSSSMTSDRARQRKETGSRESRDSKDSRDSRDSKHSRGKDGSRKTRRDEGEPEKNRKDTKEDKEERSAPSVEVAVDSEAHNKDFKESKEAKYERKEREERERKEKEERERQEKRDKEDRDRQERKEREERERREKDEERREKERLDKERQEKERRDREERERERKEREELEAREKERREKERLEKEKKEREEKERQERKDREERERKEREQRLEREKQEKERLRKEREEQEKREKEERERIERERRREEKERVERERKREREERERQERERRKEKEERERQEKEKREKEEKEKSERDKHEKEKRERREREDQERREKEKAVEREKRRDREEKEKEKRDRDETRRQPTENHLPNQNQGQVSPAPVSLKRRGSSQDTIQEDDSKRMKISDHRRDSKDRPRQNRRSEDRKHRNDGHRTSRDSRDSNRESKDSISIQSQENRESRGDGTHGELTRDSSRDLKECRENRESRENRENRDSSKDKQRSKRNRLERSDKERERSPRVSHELEKDFVARLEMSSKRSDSSPPNNQGSHHPRESQREHHHHVSINLHSDNDDGHSSTHEIQTRHPSNTDTDSDEPKKHSIFDIPDDEPVYISMYDKVKARSTKNMQKLEEEKRQVRLKDKFSQLKQCRARREEKKQSTSWDGDSVSSKALTEDEGTSESDSTRTKSLSRKGSRSRIHSDTSEEEEFNNKLHKIKTERFIESDVDLGFADTEEKLHPTDSSTLNSNRPIKEEPRSTDDEERMPVEFPSNHPVNNHQRDSRKKSHKKKQKRQKLSISSEEGVSIKIEPSDNNDHKNKNPLSGSTDCRTNHLNDSTTVSSVASSITEATEERMRADKKQRNKKDKRRERTSEDKAKTRRKRLSRQEARDSQRMEDIFGPLSDDVDEAPPTAFFNHLGNLPSENNTYATDSDGMRSPIHDERLRRKTEKKRRHHAEDENSVDLAEAGREIEAKLLGLPVSPKPAAACTESNDHDVFRFTDDNDSIEPSTPTTAPEKVKEKKKKRKKSKEERSRKDYHHHHHHHHHHHDKAGALPYLGADPSPPRASSPIPRKASSPPPPVPRESLLSPIPKNPTPTPVTSPSVGGLSSKPDKKKDKFIPGFGIEIDETIHENAVKSISEPEERENGRQSGTGTHEPEVPTPVTPPPQVEDKPRVIISQEETEDAVAALLEETFGGSTEDFSYEGEEEEPEGNETSVPRSDAPQEDVEEMQQAVESLNASAAENDADLKPDTPQSEHDLQIDTDTEEDPNYESFDLTQPPKTPDIPSFYKSPVKQAPVVPEKTAENCSPITPASARPPSPQPPPSVIAHSWPTDHKPVIKPPQTETTETEISQERIFLGREASPAPPPTSPQYKQPHPCSVPIITEAPRISAASPRPLVTTAAQQPLYQRLPVSPQSQLVPPLRQTPPRMPVVTTVCTSSVAGNVSAPVPPLVQSRIPSSVPAQLSPRVSQPLSPNGQWSRNSAINPHITQVPKSTTPPSPRIPVSVPLSAHRPDVSSQHIYSTAASQQPVIQHAPGMRALVPSYPRGGLPPLTLNIPPRPYMPVPPLVSGIPRDTNKSRDPAALGGKSVIETLIPVYPHESPQRLEEPKLSPAVMPESTNKASTSPKVPSPNQPPTFIPETAKIEINAGTSAPILAKPPTTVESAALSPRQQKQLPTITENDMLSPKQKQEMTNVHLLTTHTPRTSTPSPVIVAHGQPHLGHKSVVHTIVPPQVSSPNQSLIKTVVPVVSQQFGQTLQVSHEKIVPIVTQVHQPPVQRQQPPISPGILVVKPHVPLISTVPQPMQPITRAPILAVTSSCATPHSSVSQLVSEHKAPERLVENPKVNVEPTVESPPPVQPITTRPVLPVESIKEEEKPQMVKIQENEIKAEEPNTEVIDRKIKVEKVEVENTKNYLPSAPVDSLDSVLPANGAEIKLEPPEEVKQEEDPVKTREEEEEEVPEEPTRESNSDPLALDLVKEEQTDSKEDSDYWSAKEVNIESVIKTVDALCDNETNENEAHEDDYNQHDQETNGEIHDTSKSDEWPDTESTEGDVKKDFSNNDEQDEGVETESVRSRRVRPKTRRGGGRGGMTTRRVGRTPASGRRGGRPPRGSKQEKNKLPADVYEFHDDSEEDNAGRPRLILTIKSPGPNVAAGPNAQPAQPVAAVKEVPAEEFVSPATNTRKSKRLAEKDGSRTTVDDIIEDVVRGTGNKGLLASGAVTRRSTRHNNVPRLVTQQLNTTVESRKSPRTTRKTSRRTSETNDDSSEEKPQETPAVRDPVQEATEIVQEKPVKFEETKQPAPVAAQQKSATLEPMTLIDPVTGMLIPMRESEEGQYIPVSTASGQIQNIPRSVMEARAAAAAASAAATAAVATVTASKAVTKVPEKYPQLPRPVSEPSVVPEKPLESSSEPADLSQPSKSQTPAPAVPQPSVITKPQPAPQSVACTIQSPTTSTTSLITTAANLVMTQTTTTTNSTAHPKPTSLKAHVLNPSKLASTPVAQQIIVNKPTISTMSSQPTVQNIIKQPNQANLQGLRLQIPPGRVVSPSLSPRAKQPIPVSSTPANGKPGQPISPVLNSSNIPPNPKQHLLHAVKQQPPTIVNLPQKMPINVHSINVATAPVQRIHNPVTQPTVMKSINGQTHLPSPKAHLLQAVVPTIISGGVASPPTQPHIIPGAPAVVSVASCSRAGGPKQIPGMEPPKVEVSMSGCMMVTTASPGRGVPVPPFEASLHGPVGAAPSPGSQYGLVPPHRTQSPPLPPPAHHHANASQGDVVNHYGGLSRAGELPPPYIHLQYQQYLRAQQEALTAPRIAYHVSDARSPHLPLDPKMEASGEESHSPPLELRRTSRTPQERTTDSPQVAQVYMLHGGQRLPPPPQYNTASNPALAGGPTGARGGYYDPPPAHIRSQYPMAANEAPPDRALTPDRHRKLQVATPPHASQVPPQADSLLMLLQRYPVMWQGLLALKNDQAAVQMHFVFGNPNVARDSLPCNSDGSTPPLRIAQRMRLEQTQVDGVARKMQTDNEHCMLLALPCGRDHMDVLQQSKNLQTGFITYLQQKQAAGIVNIAAPGSQQPAYVVHIFPSCDFANESLARIAPDLLHRVAEIAHLLIVIATV